MRQATQQGMTRPMSGQAFDRGARDGQLALGVAELVSYERFSDVEPGFVRVQRTTTAEESQACA